MEGFAFDLQRFGDVVIEGTIYSTGMTDDVTLSTVYTGKTNSEADAYYWLNTKESITSTFDDPVTIAATTSLVDQETDDADNVTVQAHYTVSEISEISLPGSGAGTITAGRNVGAENPVEIKRIRNSTLTIGDTTLAFNQAGNDTSVYMGKNEDDETEISYVALKAGSFSVAAETGASINVGNADTPLVVNKPFSYSIAGANNDTINVITVNESDAVISKTGEASQVIAPASGKITVGNKELNYVTSATTASIEVDYNTATGFFLTQNGDAITLPANVVSLGAGFNIYDGTVADGNNVAINLSSLPATGYTLTRTNDNLYTASEFGGVATIANTYVITDADNYSSVLMNSDGNIKGIVIDSGVVITPYRDSDGHYADFSNIGNGTTLYGGSANNPFKVNLGDIISEGKVSLEGFDLPEGLALQINNIQPEDSLILNAFDENSDEALRFTYESGSGQILLGDDGNIWATIASGQTANNEGRLTISTRISEPKTININSTDFTVNNLGNDYSIINRNSGLSISNLVDGAEVTAEGIVSVTSYIKGATITVNGNEYSTTTNYDENVLVFNADGTVNKEASIGFTSGDWQDFEIISGTDGDDNLTGAGDSIMVEAKAGNDNIAFLGDKNTIDAGDGEDNINVTGDENSIDGGADNDYFELNGNKNTISGGEGDDNIQVHGDSNSISAGEGNDWITNHEGSNWSANAIINMGDGNDSIWNSVASVSIDAGAGDDYISNDGGNEVTIDAGDGNDLISSNADSVSIDAGAGDDEIDVGWEKSNITVAGGTGNDLTHTGYSKNFVYIYEGGNDTLETFKDTGFIVIEGGYTWSTLRTVNEEDPDNETGIVIVNVLNDTETVGTITLTDQWGWQYQYYKERVNIVSSKEELAQYNILINDEDGKNIAGTEDKNIITNNGKNLSITSGADNDEIYNSGDNVTIDAGDGKNYINNYSANNVTINSGEGNDYVKQDNGSHSPDVVYVYKGGNDTIDGFEDLSTIVLGDASVTASINVNDGTTILRLSNRNSLTFINGDFNTINFVSSLSEVPKINVTQNETSNTVVTGKEEEDAINYIRNDVDEVTIAGGRYSDYIVNRSGEEATDVSINGGDGDDTIRNEMNSLNVTIDGGAGNDSIWSDGNYLSINGGDGNDNIITGGSTEYSTIDGGAGDDTIENDSSNATILGGDGNDHITDWGNGNHSLDNIDAGNGNDFIAYNGTYSTLNGGEGDDEFAIGGSNNLIIGGNGDDNFNVDGENNTILGGAGNNSLWNSGRHNNVYIYEGGNDTLESFRDDTDFIVIEGYSWSTLRAKDDDGNETNDRIINVLNGEETIGSITLRDYSSDRFNIVDSKDAIKPFRFLDNDDSGANLSTANSNYVVRNYGQNTTIKAGSGNDIIYNWNNDEYDDEGNLISRVSPDNSFLDGGEGNNRILNDGNNSTVKTGAGNDDIWNQGNNVSISSGAGDDTINNDIGAQNVFIDAGEGNNYIGNGNGSPDGIIDWGGHSATIKAGAGNDEIFNIGSKVSINAGDGDNTISSSRDEVTIEAGAGNDNISHMSHKTLINAGDGNNSILSVGDNVTINTGSGNDFIDNNEGAELLINAGAGEDSINSFGDKVTVDGGEGSDTIDNWGDGSSLFGGEGNDLINNLYGSGVTINGGAGDDSVQISGSDNIINVSEGNDTIFVGQDGASFTVEGFGTGDAIILAEEVSLIKKVDDKIVAGNATIGGLGGTVSELAWLLDGDIATYAEKISGEVGLSADEKTITYTSGNEIGDVLVTVSGVTSTDGLDIDVENKTVTVKAASLRQDKVVSISEGYELRLGDDVVQNVEYTEAGWRLNGTTATYVNGATTEGYALENNQIVYQTTDADKTLITINGVISIDELGEPEDRVVTIHASSLSKDSPVTISDGYELKLAEDVPQPTEEQAAGWRFNDNVATYVNGSTFEGYTVKNNRIVWQTGGEGEALVTISGIKNIDGLSEPVDKIVTISAASLSEDSTVTISDGYTLALADDVDKSTQGEIEWTLNGTTAIGKIPSTTGGYTIENNQISYIAAGENSGVEVYGVTSTEGLVLNDKTITVSRAALNGVEKPVRVSSGYKLALGDVTQPFSTNESWSTDGDKIIYSSAVRTAGYGLSNNQIIYIEEKIGETVEIIGVKTDIISEDGTTAEGITRAGDTFTIAEAALNQVNVKISEGYKLALESDVTAPIRTPAGWQRNESTATYKTSSTTAGYKLVNNEIVYTDEDGGTDLVTVNGINRTDGLSIDVNNKVVTVSNSALSETEITIEGNEYTLALGDDVETPDSKSGWSFDGKKATYQEGAAYDGYKLSDDKKIISHVDATDGEIKVEIEGIEVVPTFANDEHTIIKLTENILEEDVTILKNNGVEFEIDSGSYSEITFGGSSSKDSITNNGEDIIFDLGAGIDRIKNNAANVTINGGSGNDRINNSVDGVEIK